MNDMTPPQARERVRLITDLGDLVIELHADKSPASVDGFLRYVDERSYDGGAFTRSVRPENDHGSPLISVIQGQIAGLTADVRLVEHETTELTGLKHRDGAVSLPRGAKDGGTPAALFICIGDQPGLDFGAGRAADNQGFAVFGQVVEGMDVVRAIHDRPTALESPDPYTAGQEIAEPVAIYSAQREGADPAAKVAQLAEDYWAFRVREFPLEAIGTVDRSQNHRLEGCTGADHARRARLAQAMLARARAVDAAALGDEDAATLSLLVDQCGRLVEIDQLRGWLTPELFPFGFQEAPGMVVSMVPLNDRKDVEDFLARLEGVPDYFDENLARLEAGIAEGFRMPRVLLARTKGLIHAHIAEDGLRARALARIATLPAGLSAEFAGRAERALDEAVLPAFQRLLDFLQTRADDFCRDTLSVCDQPQGRDYYRFKVRQQTSTDLEPEAIHAIGLDEVAALRVETEAVAARGGFPGDVRGYAAELDTRIEPTAERLLEKTRALAKRIDGLIPRLIGRMPRITYTVDPFTVEQSKDLPPALAQPSPPDRSLPGVYWITALPEKCPNHLLVPLGLHEAWPGHLMQFALAHEQEHLPAFRRYGWTEYNGYVEGWALYTERLGHDIGLYDDPADHFGRLSFDLWRACRLVVDTGLHWLDWSREQAIRYMADNCFMPRETIESEVDRYIGMPAQALSYKLGERVMRSLRATAEQRLGEAFSLRAFHDEVLAVGPVSLTVLETHMQRWVSARAG
jgi:uncharacterized protein (DUF885 family)/cyclophilin family peptidyl-prolyl cis-trans isomerase